MTPATSAPAAFPQGLVRMCAVLCAAVLAVSLLPQLAHAEGSFEFSMAPQRSGDTAIKAQTAEDRVVLSGSGLPSGTINSAEWIALDADGNEVRDRVYLGSGSGALNKPGVPGLTEDFVYNNNGSLSGQLTVPSVFGDPDTANPGVNPCTTECVVTAVLELRIGAATGSSNRVAVDYTRPRIERYDVVAPDQIRVVFTEPVRMRQGSLESPTLWTVAGVPARTVLAVEGPTEGDCRFSSASGAADASGCTRTLRVAPAIGEDDTPVVEYTSTTSLTYVDRADSRLFDALGVDPKPTIDRIRPAAPDIQAIEDGTPNSAGEVIGRYDSPTVLVGNLTGGHDVTLTVTRNGSVVDTRTTPVPAGATQEAFTPALPGDGEYTLTVVATDGEGNRSDDSSLRAARADGRFSVTYVLDRVAPEILAATKVDTKTVDVVLTEPVTPANNAGSWKIGDIPATATGTGATRRLTTDIATDTGVTVTWAPDGSAYADRAGNELVPVAGLPLSDLPSVPAPTVTTPHRGTWTRSDTVTIAGTAPSSSVTDTLVAQLFHRSGDEPIDEVSAASGSWAFTHTLAANRRTLLQVRLRDTATQVHGPRATVPDIVHDTTKPVVDVRMPAGAGLLGGPQEYGAGDSVTITWVATDRADDPKRPDHSKAASVFLVAGGDSRALKTGIVAQPGQEQTFTYTLRKSDLAGRGLRDLAFRVDVADFAGNTGSDLSGTIRLLADRVGYTPVLVAPGVIEARFGDELQGTMMPGDWRVAGQPVLAEPPMDRNGTTIVKLHAPLDSDPNARPEVAFAPSLPAEQRLRSTNDTQISTTARQAVDAIKPALTVQRPDTPRVIDANSVRFNGTTDVTSRPNTVIAYRSDAAGNRKGPALASGTAKTDGSWTFRVPLEADRLNRIVFRAVDPSGNRSRLAPEDPYKVREDSIKPVVRLAAPRSGTRVGPTTNIRWTTIERNRKEVRIAYRLRNSSKWQSVTTSTADDGHYKWRLPKALRNRVFQLNVVAIDATGKRGPASAKGLLADFDPPVLRRARALGPRKVRLFFNEPVNMTRAGFTVDGIAVRKVVKKGSKQTLLLKRSVGRTTPRVTYKGTRARDLAGNKLAATKITAERAFTFSVTDLKGKRLSSRSVRLAWRDVRNRPAHVAHYRIYRNGKRIGTVGWSARSFTDSNAGGSNLYVVRAVDNAKRVSSGKAVRVR